MNSIYELFSKTVDDYDYVADKVVFENDKIHEELIKALPFKKNQFLKILDLGSGTGHGMEMILENFPKARVIGIDYSLKMIEHARKNLSDFLNRVKLIENDFCQIKLGNDFDAVVSVIAIHNSTDEHKIEIFEKIYNSLKKGGVFINADFFIHESPEKHEENKRIYREYLENNLEGDEKKVWLRHAFEEDMPMKLSEQFEILKKIGFSEVEKIWEYVNEAIYVAKK